MLAPKSPNSSPLFNKIPNIGQSLKVSPPTKGWVFSDPQPLKTMDQRLSFRYCFRLIQKSLNHVFIYIIITFIS